MPRPAFRAGDYLRTCRCPRARSPRIARGPPNRARMESVGVGILGSGFMGRTWSAVVGATPGARLTAVAGGRRAPDLAADYAVRAIEPTELLTDPEVDLVLVLT